MLTTIPICQHNWSITNLFITNVGGNTLVVKGYAVFYTFLLTKFSCGPAYCSNKKDFLFGEFFFREVFFCSTQFLAHRNFL